MTSTTRNLPGPQVPGQRHPVGAGALHADPGELSEAAHPGQQLLVASGSCRELLGAQHTTDGGDNRGDVNIEVGVDAAGDEGACFCDGGHVRPLARTGRAGTVRRWSDSPGTGA